MSKRTKKFVSIILMIMMLCCVPQARIMAEEEGDQTNIDDVTEVAPDNSADDAVDNADQEPEAEETAPEENTVVEIQPVENNENETVQENADTVPEEAVDEQAEEEVKPAEETTDQSTDEAVASDEVGEEELVVEEDSSLETETDDLPETETKETMVGMKLMNTKNAVLLGDANDASKNETSEIPPYVVIVEMPKEGEIADSPDVEEKYGRDDNISVSSAWTASIENAKLAQEYFAGDLSKEFEAFTGVFQAETTYYGIAIAHFDEGDKASADRVSIEKTERIEQVGNAIVVEASNTVVLIFSVTIEKMQYIQINVIFGDKHVEYAKKAATYFGDTKVTRSGSTLSYSVPKGSKRYPEALAPIRSALFDMKEIRSGDEEIYVMNFMNLKPVDQYSSAKAYNTDYDEIESNETQNEDLTVYISWLKPTNLVVDIEPLICGTEVSFDKDNAESSPLPGLSIVSGEGEVPENHYGHFWVAEGETEPFIGPVVGGNKYIAHCDIYPKFGYYINSISCKTGTLLPNLEVESGELMILVEAEHDWESQKIIEPSIEGANGKEAVKCRHDLTFRYYVESGNGSSWTKGSSSDLSFVFKRSVDDKGTYDVFFKEGGIVKVDDKEISSDKYEAEKGSLKLSLKKDYLETLSEGSHKVTVVFNDEVPDKGSSYISANFTILKKSDGGSNSRSSSTVKYHAPKTGIE